MFQYYELKDTSLPCEKDIFFSAFSSEWTLSVCFLLLLL